MTPEQIAILTYYDSLGNQHGSIMATARHFGIGGLTIPLTKFIHRANQQRHAIHDHIGHYHQLFRHPDFTINGSLVGFDSYALSIGARPERPQQAFQLIDAKRGFTVAAPILLEDAK